ncbi:unnamed protein product [Ambrosiozyma monospora]|uniref:Unnamed protein product n=1 Tax=Ambrosiozyma monospora TaxID=43982 RepID=A0ACB5SSF5_AMBMO|nr:unnamed protein product [Ambrosiozyma monospora]
MGLFKVVGGFNFKIPCDLVFALKRGQGLSRDDDGVKMATTNMAIMQRTRKQMYKRQEEQSEKQLKIDKSKEQ